MSGRFFLDTNVLVYSLDAEDPEKQERSRQLVEEALQEGSGVISFQVIQEFLSVATRKFATAVRPEDLGRYLRQVLMPLCEVQSSLPLYEQALDVRERWKVSFYDALILAAALAAGCDTLYSEDLEEGLKVRELTVVNPF